MSRFLVWDFWTHPNTNKETQAPSMIAAQTHGFKTFYGTRPNQASTTSSHMEICLSRQSLLRDHVNVVW